MCPWETRESFSVWAGDIASIALIDSFFWFTVYVCIYIYLTHSKT